MNVWDIILLCLIMAAIIYTAVFSVLSRVRAKKAGIIRVKIPASKTGFVCHLICFALGVVLSVIRAGDCAEYKKTMDDLQTLGIQKFYKERNNWDVTPVPPETEQSATANLLSEYRAKYDRERNRIELQMLAAITFASAALFNGAYITKQGVFMFGDIKPRNTAAMVEDGMLCFQSKGKHEFTMLRLPANEENLRLYSEFIVKGKAEPQQI